MYLEFSGIFNIMKLIDELGQIDRSIVAEYAKAKKLKYEVYEIENLRIVFPDELNAFDVNSIVADHKVDLNEIQLSNYNLINDFANLGGVKFENLDNKEKEAVAKYQRITGLPVCDVLDKILPIERIE